MYLCRFTPQMYSFHKRIATSISHFEIMPIRMSKMRQTIIEIVLNATSTGVLLMLSNVPSVVLRSTSEHHSGASWCGRRSSPLSSYWSSLLQKGEELNNHVERLVEQVNAAGPVQTNGRYRRMLCLLRRICRRRAHPIARTCGHVVCLKCEEHAYRQRFTPLYVSRNERIRTFVLLNVTM
jgi:hypothetical protein